MTNDTARRSLPLDAVGLDVLAKELHSRRASVYERLGKPAMDRVLAALLLLVLSPVLLATALFVLVAVGRPLLYPQCRAGLDGAPFTMLKFRTMQPDRRLRARRRRAQRRSGTRRGDRRSNDRRRTHKTAEDPRHTRIGRLLRRTSLDEMPQLINVVRGDMSLVGPRPELCGLVEGFVPWQHARHLVRPGITGLWQTTERGRGALLHECIELDLFYIRDLSPMNDMRILLRTPFALLRNKGVV